jgi:surface antigen
LVNATTGQAGLAKLTTPQKILKRPAIRRRFVNLGIVGANLLLLAGVAAVVLIHPGSSSASQTTNYSALSSEQLLPQDKLASANIAEMAAQMTGVGELIPITNQADTARAFNSQAAMADSTLSAKPQVVASTYKSNKEIELYTVQKGDSLASIANQFNVSEDSIRWSNGLSDNHVKVGSKLRIPPVDGIVYKVKKGDTIAKLANKYNIAQAKLIGVNDAELKGIKPGEYLLLPGASKAEAPVSHYSYGRQAVYGYNGYTYGYCTYWVAHLREQDGDPVPVGLGDASSWPFWAQRFGLPVDHSPSVGAAVVTSTVGEGHVAYVTGVNKAAGTITISEMNHRGWNITDTRTLPASSSYYYIH